MSAVRSEMLHFVPCICTTGRSNLLDLSFCRRFYQPGECINSVITNKCCNKQWIYEIRISELRGQKNKLNILRWSSLNLILSPAVLTDEFLVFVIQFIFVLSRVYNDPTQ